MDTGAPAAEAAAADEPLPPAHGIDREVTPKPAGNPDLMQQSLDNPAIPMHLIEKRDDRRESCDDGYSLTVNESAIDIESLACSYDSNAFFLRARFIARHCPILRADAYISLINYLKEHTTDITHYVAFFNELESELARKEFKNRQLNFQIPLRDQKWIEENGATWQSTTDQLQAEYKRHKDEGVKESTRRAMEDLFQHYMMAGKIDEAIRLYSRGIRDYCTQLKHSINMWINWMEVAICANDWGKLDTVTNTAYRSLKDADDAEKNSQQSQQAPPQRGENAPYMVERDPNAPIQTLTNRQLIETALAKCLAAQVLLKLRNKRYSQVVETILQIKTECLQSKWFVTSSDLGIYGMLSAMATMSRADLKLQVSGNGTFRKLLESEPQLIELLGSYTSSRFGRCFEIMRSVKPRLLLDPFISRNVDELFEKIRQKCVLQYLQPYSTIKMATMAEAVGMSSAELQLSLLELIEQKHVSLKIDQNEGIVRILDERDENAILKRVNVTCDRATQKAKSLLWKTTLAGANIHSISDKETRPKRKNQKESAKFDRNFGGIDVDEDPRGIAGPSGLSDDFNIAYDQQPQQQVQYLEDLGDI